MVGNFITGLYVLEILEKALNSFGRYWGENHFDFHLLICIKWCHLNSTIFTPKDVFDVHSLGVHVCIVHIWLIELIFLSNVFTPIHSISMTWLFEYKSMVWFFFCILFLYEKFEKSKIVCECFWDTPLYARRLIHICYEILSWHSSYWLFLPICLFGDIIKRGIKNYHVMGEFFHYGRDLIY